MKGLRLSIYIRKKKNAIMHLAKKQQLNKQAIVMKQIDLDVFSSQ